MSDIIKVETIEEANAYLKKKWKLIDNGHVIVNNEPQFFFVLEKTGMAYLAELRNQAEQEEQEQNKKVTSLRPES